MNSVLLAKMASNDMAALYIWDAVVCLLEGSTRPNGKVADRVIKMAKQEMKRHLANYDKRLALIAAESLLTSPTTGADGGGE